MPRSSYANFTATLALFVALGGSSYAALKVTGQDVRDDSLTGREVRALTGHDVKDGSLSQRDFAAEDLPAPSLVTQQSVGYHGDPGPNDQGGPVMAPNTAQCRDGEVATGGGVQAFGGADAAVVDSQPVGAGPVPTGWAGTSRYTREAWTPSFPPIVWAVCASF